MVLQKFESSGFAKNIPDSDKTGHKENIKKLILDYANSRPRQVQVSLGPSSVGNACDRSLVGMMSGVHSNNGESSSDTNPWFSIIGSSVHTWLAEMFETIPGWLVEQRVEIGSPAVPYGHCDLFNPELGLVADHKILGKEPLQKLRVEGPSRVYREQLHVYGLGWTRMGYVVNEVLLIAYPRNPSAVLPFLHEAVLWSEPFDKDLAEKSIARVDKLQQEALKLKAAKAKNLLSIPANPGKDCFWCPFNKPSMCPDGIKS